MTSLPLTPMLASGALEFAFKNATLEGKITVGALVVVSLSAAWGVGELLGWRHSLDHSPREAPRFYAVYFAEVLPAAAVVLVSGDLTRLCVGAMVFNVVVLALPLAFLVRMTSDRELLGDLVNSRAHTALLWFLTASVLAAGAFGMFQFLT